MFRCLLLRKILFLQLGAFVMASSVSTLTIYPVSTAHAQTSQAEKQKQKKKKQRKLKKLKKKKLFAKKRSKSAVKLASMRCRAG